LKHQHINDGVHFRARWRWWYAVSTTLIFSIASFSIPHYGCSSHLVTCTCFHRYGHQHKKTHNIIDALSESVIPLVGSTSPDEFERNNNIIHSLSSCVPRFGGLDDIGLVGSLGNDNPTYLSCSYGLLPLGTVLYFGRDDSGVERSVSFNNQQLTVWWWAVQHLAVALGFATGGPFRSGLVVEDSRAVGYGRKAS
jgi:hypothetical protein